MVVVLDIQGNVAMVQLPDTSVEEWDMASLPGGVSPGDRLGVTVTGGDLDMVLLPRPRGLRA